MFTWLNGDFIDETIARVPVNDRGFLYGDGLFETIRAYQGHLFRFDSHWNRLQAGADYLKIALPEDAKTALRHASELLHKNGLADAVVRLQITRGAGHRGYLPQGIDHPTWLMTCHPLPDLGESVDSGWKLVVSHQRLASFDSSRRFKTCNRIPQILARLEADKEGANEAILLNEKEDVVECAGANIFWLDQGVLYTPPMESGLLPGVTRAVVMELSDRLEIECVEKTSTIPDLVASEAVFLTQSVMEIIPVTAIGPSTIPRHPLEDRLRQEYHALALSEKR